MIIRLICPLNSVNIWYVMLILVHFKPYLIRLIRKGKDRMWRVAKYGDPYSEFVLCI